MQHRSAHRGHRTEGQKGEVQLQPVHDTVNCKYKVPHAAQSPPAVAAAAVAAVMVVLCDCQMLVSCSQVASDREVAWISRTSRDA
jgi:hypothetical protein